MFHSDDDSIYLPSRPATLSLAGQVLRAVLAWATWARVCGQVPSSKFRGKIAVKYLRQYLYGKARIFV